MSIGEGEIMRPTTRRFLAAMLLTAAAGFALSQEANAPPPPASGVAAPVAAKSAIPETPAESGSRSTMILGEWMLAGVLTVALFSITQLIRRRRTERRDSMVDLSALALELKPAPATPRL
jgi:hypothetical protein